MAPLNGSRIAVVGSQTALGRAAVAAFLEAGAQVVGADPDPDSAGDAGPPVERAIATLGGLDVLVNLTKPEPDPLPADQVGRDDWERVFKATVRAARTSNQAAFRHMSAGCDGLILNHADQSAEVGVPGMALVSAAAQAVVALSNASAGAWRGSGVRINVVQPALDADPVNTVAPMLVFLAAGSAPLHGQRIPC